MRRIPMEENCVSVENFSIFFERQIYLPKKNSINFQELQKKIIFITFNPLVNKNRTKTANAVPVNQSIKIDQILYRKMHDVAQKQQKDL